MTTEVSKHTEVSTCEAYCAVCQQPGPAAGKDWLTAGGWHSRPGYLDRLGWVEALCLCPSHSPKVNKPTHD